MSNHVRILAGFHTNFSLFGTNPALAWLLSTNFHVFSNLETPNSMPKPSSKKQAMCFTTILSQYRGNP